MSTTNHFKPVEKLEFSDDFMFCKIMQDKTICKGVIERLLKIKIDRIEYPEIQKALAPLYDKKSIRFDVYVASSDRILDVEMQSYTEKDLGKRTRYYQSLLDMDNLLKGQHYSELKECYVIFLCLYDPFEKGLPVYSFNRVCKESTDIDLQDSTHHIFFNCNAFEKEDDAELKAFLSYVKDNNAGSNFTRRIADMVQQKKFEQTFINEYMAIKLHDYDIEQRAMAAGMEKGLEKGLEKGIAQGEAKGKTDAAIGMLKFGLPLETIEKCTGLSVEYLKTLV